MCWREEGSGVPAYRSPCHKTENIAAHPSRFSARSCDERSTNATKTHTPPTRSFILHSSTMNYRHPPLCTTCPSHDCSLFGASKLQSDVKRVVKHHTLNRTSQIYSSTYANDETIAPPQNNATIDVLSLLDMPLPGIFTVLSQV